MRGPRRILILGASYGALLGTKLAAAGHHVTLVGLPFPVLLSLAMLVLTVLLTQKTAIGLFIESVGDNQTANPGTLLGAPLVVKVERPGLPDAIVSTTWTVAPTPGTYVGGERLTRFVALAVGGLVAAWLLMLVVEGLLRPRRRVDLTDDRHELDREALTL